MKQGHQQLQDGFLADVDNLHYRILCCKCRSPLWVTKILKREGARVISTDTQKLDDRVPTFSRFVKQCPYCKAKEFFERSKQGQQCYLIHDLKSNITRLV